MLDWIKTRLKPTDDASDHPLGSDAGIDEWLQEILAGDPQRVLLALEEWLLDPEHLAGQLTPLLYSRAVERLDDFSHPATLECWAALLKGCAQNQHSVTLIRLLENHHQRLHAAHWLALRQLLAGTPASENKELLTRHALRAMHAWVRSKTLTRMFYRDPGAGWWQMAHQMNQMAREHGIQHTAHPPYRKMEASTLWREFLSGILFETAPLANLSPNEIEACERIARMIEPRSLFADAPTTFTLFYLDFDQNNGPARYATGVATGEQRRFFGPGAGYQNLIQLRALLAGADRLPGWLESTALTPKQALALAGKLLEHWSTTPPQRAQPRHRINGKLLVVNRLEIVRRMVAASEFAHSGRSLDYEGYVKALTARHRDHAIVPDVPPPPRTPMDVLQLLETAGDRQMMEQWEVADISKQGLGARSTGRRPWHTIGALVGFRPEDEIDWHVGIIRRLGSLDGKPSIGLTTFGGTPQVSQIRPCDAATESLWSSQTQETSGLGWRDAIVVSSDDCLLLAPPGIFEAERRIDISIAGRFRPAVLVELLGQGNDYELVRYREADDSTK